MSPELEEFLKQCEIVEGDQAMLDHLNEEMAAAIPEIERRIRERQRLAEAYRRGHR